MKYSVHEHLREQIIGKMPNYIAIFSVFCYNIEKERTLNTVFGEHFQMSNVHETNEKVYGGQTMSKRKLLSVILLAFVTTLMLACAVFFTACGNNDTPNDGQNTEQSGENPDDDNNPGTNPGGEDDTPGTNPGGDDNPGTDEPQDIAVTAVLLDKTSLTLEIGESYTLIATISPSNATDKSITWASSAPSVAEVSQGKVTALSAGMTTITATSANGKSAECTVTVTSESEGYFIASYDTITGVTPEGRQQTRLEIPSVINGTPITRINAYALSGLSNLKEVIVPDSVTEIGIGAFNGCNALSGIMLPFIGANAENIGASYFGHIFGANNYSENGIVVPSTLKSVYVTGGTSIRANAFRECSYIKTVSLPSSITKIDSYAFYRCDLTTIELPENLERIENWAFSECNGLTDVTIPDSVTSIGDSAFNWCKGLTSVRIGKGLTSIGTAAFSLCDKLTGVYITDLSAWCNIAFEGGSANPLCYAHNIYLDNIHITDLVIPDDVKSIGNYAFYYCSKLTSVTIPDSVTSIGDSAFAGCSGLTSVTVPDNVMRIGDSAFRNCSRLTSITVPFVGEKADGSGVTHFGYMFGRSYNSYDIPKSLKEVIISGNNINIADDAFYGCDGLTNITIGDGVERIGSSAFEECDSLERINIPFIGEKADGSGATHFGYIFGANSYSDNNKYVPKSLKEVNINDGVTNICDSAFRSCSSLTNVTIPDSITSIGSFAFSGCSGLTSITLPDSVMSIEESTFSGCNRLTSITIPDNVTSIGNSAFSGCSGLTSITIPSSVMSIGGYALSGCSGLTSVTIENGVTSIKYSAFRNCSSLSDVTIPDSVTSIGDSAFEGCSGLTSVTIGNGVTTIGRWAFQDCIGLKCVTILGGVSSIEEEAFSGCDGLIGVYITDLSAWCNISFGSSDANPLCYAKNLYLNDVLVTDLIIPDDVTSIGDYVFYWYYELTSVTIPDSVTNIGYSAFFGCDGLTGVYITDLSAWCNISFKFAYANPLVYAQNLYLNNVLVTDLVIPDDVTSIGNYSFSDCSGLTSIVIPDSVTRIGDSAFSGCSELTSVTIGNGVTSIGDSAFSGCGELTSVTIGNGVKSIGESAFSDCSELTSITIPDSVTSIGFFAFAACSELKSVTIGNGVTSIGDSAFSGCSGLTSIIIPNSVTSIGSSAFYNCSGLTSITVPSSVTSIGDSVFYGCSGLISITVPFVGEKVDGSGATHFGHIFGAPSYYDNNNSLYIPAKIRNVDIIGATTSIGDYAFYNCGWLTSITIGSGVTSIGSYAFYNCSGLTGVYITDLSAWCNISFGSSDANPLCYAKNLYLNDVLVTDLIIPDDVTSIGDYVFYWYYELTSVTIPDSVTNIGYSAFFGCDGLTGVYITDLSAWCNILFESYNANPLSDAQNLYLNDVLVTNLVIPNDVTNIGNYAFSGCSGLTSIVIPDSVTSIGSSAFSGCSGLTSIVIPDSVTSIGDYAFQYCSGLTSITIPNSVTSIGDSAFSSCSGLTSIVISDSVTSIGSNVFWGTAYYNNSSNWENNVLYIGNYLVKAKTSIGREYAIKEGTLVIADAAFYNCKRLTSITINNGITRIGNSVFRGCDSLVSAAIPASVTSISDDAFYGCNGLTSVYITDLSAWCNILFESYNANPLSDAQNLYLNDVLVTDLVIPNDVTSIGNYAFYGCSGLTSVTIPDSVTSIGEYAFAGCSGLTSVTIGNGVKSIGNSAFRGCRSLSDVIIPDSVTSIGDYAFQYCSGLTSITIPNSVTNIGDSVFIGCGKLTNIYCEAESQPSNWSVYWNDGCNAIIHWGYRDE